MSGCAIVTGWLVHCTTFCQFARQQVTVALSGDGADELFGGYYRTRVIHLARHLDLLPGPVRRGLHGVGRRLLPADSDERGMAGRLRRLLALLPDSGLGRYERVISRASLSWRKRLYGPKLAPFLAQSQPLGEWANHYDGPAHLPVNALMELELRSYLVDDILVKVDRASMAHSLEVRSPYLDREVVQFALTLPYEFKQQGTHRKRILMDAGAGLLPPEIYQRPKMGFGVPVANWLRGPWKALARELLLEGWFTKNGWFQRAGLAAMLKEHDANKADHSYPIYALMVLELWHQGRRA